MGGDFAPAEIVQGGVDFARETGRRVLLVGRPERIEPVLAATETAGADVEVVPARDVIGFDDTIQAIRRKRNSSLHVGTRLVRDGEAAGFVSAGHTGALMALGKVVLGVIPGVQRPALPAPLPRRGEGYTILLDVGANVDCRPEHLVQFAVMGTDYAARIFGVERPRVALLSIGEEETKRNDLVQETAELLRGTSLNFVGNCEGNSLFSDVADVVVCDGFVGNVALKVAEGLAEAIYGMLKDEVAAGSLLNLLGGLAMRPAFKNLKRKIDYAETGGVPLLGLRGVVVVAHGRSTARAVRGAMHVAAHAAERDLVGRIGREIGGLGPLAGPTEAGGG
ncbi:MAG: phosphate acyltransferase PlsX [Acidobacteriota bacterium]|nr:MAG: phosphate acyltransferase PlsX [Acidobacteriota bacterium]